jgi:predicted porin
MVEVGGLRAEAQVSGNDATSGRSTGGLLRYSVGEFAAAGAYVNQKDIAGKNVKATTLGGAWTSGPWYVNVGWARNKFDAGFNAVVNATLAGSIIGALNSAAALADHRDMWSVGSTYQLTPQLNLGAQYWNAKQTGTVSLGDGKGDFYAFVSDYAFTKRTDAYLELDHTKIGGNLSLANGARARDGYTLGLRHRF